MSSDRPTFVLVHGAWHGGWCWKEVAARLRARGATVLVADLPSCSPDPSRAEGLAEDAATVEDLCGQAPGPVVLVGHSYGGMVLSAVRLPTSEVHRLVYVCAFVPTPGLPLVGHFSALPPYVEVREDGTAGFRREMAREVLYNRCDDAVAADATSRLVLHGVRAITTPIDQPSWQRHPSTYVVCTEDHTIPEPMQRAFAEHADVVVELTTDHSPMLSCPDDLVEILLAASA